MGSRSREAHILLAFAPFGVSSMTQPLAFSSSRMASARLKSFALRAAWRASSSAVISAGTSTSSRRAHAEHGIKLVPRRQRARGGSWRSRYSRPGAGSSRGPIQRPRPRRRRCSDRRPARRRTESVDGRRPVLAVRRAGHLAQLAQAFVNPRQRRPRALQTFQREIERLAVMRGEQQIADFAPVKPLPANRAA